MMSKSVFLTSVAVGLIITFPTVAEGAVIINEIAWMGTTNSANDEWIELHNNGSTAVSVDGWRLSDGQSLDVALAGTISAGSYVVLERTDDDSAAGTAFLIYTGALSNAGGTLSLRDSSNNLVDQVAGGEHWEAIGGDNTTKETAQYTTSGWVTAVATPGSANATESSVDDEVVSDDQPSTKSQSSSGSVRSRKYVSEPVLVKSTAKLELSIAVPERVFVNQPVTFIVTPKNLGDSVSNSLQYSWNFGDLSVGRGEEVRHTYTHPGEYIVSVRGQFARHDEIVRVPVTVLPVTFSITKNDAGDVQVHNDAPYAVNVSGFTLSGTNRISFPKDSFIPARGTVTVGTDKIGGSAVALRDTTGAVLAIPKPPVKVAALEPVASRPPVVVATRTTQPTKQPTKDLQNFTFATAPTTEVAPNETPKAAVSDQPLVSAAVIEAEAPLSQDLYPLLGLLGIVALGLFGAYLGSQKM